MQQETTSFDPKTWVSSEPVRPQEQASPAQQKPPKRFKPLWILGPIGFAAILGGGVFFWPSNSDGTNELVDTKTGSTGTANPNARSNNGSAAASVRIINISDLEQLEESFVAMGVPDTRARSIARETIAALGSEGDMRVSVELIGNGAKKSVRTITAEMEDGTTIKLTRKKDGSFDRENILGGGKSQVRTASGTIDQNTFYASAVEAGVPDSLITEFAKAFSFDFDFQRDVKIGDSFSATWEETVTASGRSISPPRLLYVEMESAGKSRKYFAFVPPEEPELRWFDETGKGAQRGLMRTPVDGARITSKYGYRTHPISRRQKKHNGVDFAAPTGTPVYASGNATVLFRARAGGAGNLIKLDHGEGMQTWYMHLNAFAEDLALGGEVTQGQVIGFVGSTGASTGPHLHYEIRLAGEPTDPLTYETSETEALVGAALTMYRSRREETKAAMRKGD